MGLLCVCCVVLTGQPVAGGSPEAPACGGGDGGGDGGGADVALFQLKGALMERELELLELKDAHAAEVAHLHAQVQVKAEQLARCVLMVAC